MEEFFHIAVIPTQFTDKKIGLDIPAPLPDCGFFVKGEKQSWEKDGNVVRDLWTLFYPDQDKWKSLIDKKSNHTRFGHLYVKN